MNTNEYEQEKDLVDEWDSDDTRDGIKKRIRTRGMQQYPETGWQLGELYVYARNRYHTEAVADAAIYKQHRSMGKVNYPWLLTRNEIIKLFPLAIYRLKTT